MKQLLSIIIPVYNSKKYLKQCINSVLEQDYANIEVILIDDGSTDGSEHICEKYKEKDSRIKVIHQNNRGQGAARNRGLDICNGELITFVDSDDFVDEKIYSTLITIKDKAKAQIVCCGMSKVKEGNKLEKDISYSNKLIVFNNREALINHLENKIITASVCDKVFDRNLFNNTRFMENVKYEDLEIIPRVLNQCTTVVYTGEPLYYYEQSENSTMRGYSEEKFFDLAVVSKKRYDFYRSIGLENRETLENHLLTCIYSISNTRMSKDSNRRKLIVEEINKHIRDKEYVLLDKTLKTKVWICTNNLQMFDWICNIYHKI